MQLWRFYEQAVGIWTIESNRSPFTYPLGPGEDVSGPAREYFCYLLRALDAMGDLLAIRRVESPPGSVILKSYAQLAPSEVQKELVLSWDAEAKKTGGWRPAALLGGLSRVYVKEGPAVLPVEIPDALRLCLAASRDRYTLTLATNCDLWLERFVSGEDNAEAGSLNAARLGRAIERLEEAMDGSVAGYASEIEGVRAGPRGFS
jgi:hypothetical protein